MKQTGPRSFDPVLVGNRETDVWVAYYRRDWLKFLRSSVGLVAAGFGMSPASTLTGTWYVLKANQLWAPYGADKDAVRSAAGYRVEAMACSDRWVAAGCSLDDRLLVEERRALVSS